MFNKIMVPIDLAHSDRMEAAMTVAADIAKHYGAQICYVGATTSTPSSTAHTPQEYSSKLEEFAKKEGAAHGHEVTTHTIISHDPTADLDHDLVKAVDEVGADLVVMATHVPNIADHIWPSNGGRLATHTKASVFLVRADASK